MIRWFGEQVFPNLVASALWTWPVLGWHHKKVVRVMKETVKKMERRGE